MTTMRLAMRRLTQTTCLALLLIVPIASPQAQSRSAETKSELEHVWRVDGPIMEVVRHGAGGSYSMLLNIGAFSSDGQLVAILPQSTGSDRLEIRSATDGALVYDIRYPQELGLAYDIAMSPTGAIALGRHGVVNVYDRARPDVATAMFESDPTVDMCRVAKNCRTSIGSLAFSPDGSLLAFQELSVSTLPVPSYDQGSVYVVEMATGRRVAKLTANTGRPTHVAFSRDGRRLVAMHYTDVMRRGPIGFRVWDTSSWKLLTEVTGLGKGFEPLAIGAVDGAAFAAVYAAAGGRIELRDVERDTVLWSVPLYSPQFERKPTMAGGEEPTLDHVAIAPNGKFVVGYEGPGWMINRGPLDEPDSLGYFGAIVVRNTGDGSIVSTYDIRNVNTLAISPDSKTLLYSVGFHQTYVALARLP
jgi:WD40 repeat protein